MRAERVSSRRLVTFTPKGARTGLTAFRVVISLYYGYYGYKDKSSSEMLAVNLEFAFDVAMFVGFLAVAALVWRRMIGAWSAFLMLGPA